jgi:hypothetical protein
VTEALARLLFTAAICVPVLIGLAALIATNKSEFYVSDEEIDILFEEGHRRKK